MIRDVFVRSAFNYDMDAASNEAGLLCLDATMAQQSARDECDINTIVKRFGITGQLPENVRVPTYEDFTNVVDFHSAMNAVRSAAESFMEMPADVRARFQNDAGKFVDFCANPENIEEMRKLGLAVPAEAVIVPAAASGGSGDSGGDNG